MISFKSVDTFSQEEKILPEHYFLHGRNEIKYNIVNAGLFLSIRGCGHFLDLFKPLIILNLTWTHNIDRVKTQELIDRIFEMIPVNKVQVFGGDYLYPQNVRYALEITRENIAAVLF